MEDCILMVYENLLMHMLESTVRMDYNSLCFNLLCLKSFDERDRTLLAY